MLVLTLKNRAASHAPWLNPWQPRGFLASLVSRPGKETSMLRAQCAIVGVRGAPNKSTTRLVYAANWRGPRRAAARSLPRPDHCRERLQSSKVEVRPSLRGPTGLEPRKRLDHGPDCDLAFKSRQRSPQAVVRPMCKTQVPIVIPGNVEFIGASEPHRIAVGSSDHRCQEVARLDAVAPDVHGHRCTTPCRLNGQSKRKNSSTARSISAGSSRRRAS